MVDFDPRPALDQLAAEYSKRAEAIRRDLGRSHSPDFAEQAQQRQNDDVLRALLAEAEAGKFPPGEAPGGHGRACAWPTAPMASARAAARRSRSGACVPFLPLSTACAAPTQWTDTVTNTALPVARGRRENAGESPRPRAARSKDLQCPIPLLPACAWRPMN